MPSRSSASTIPFKLAFKGSSDREMQADGRREGNQNLDGDDYDTKKHHSATTGQDNEEAEDIELSEKKDRPPRFSTLFAGAPLPIPTERESRRDKKSGVFLPMPVFIVLVLVLFFESTLLFAYTIIGLYNNRPAGLLPGRPSPIGNFNACASKPAGIHIAPNFVMAQPTQAPITITTTITVHHTKTTTATLSQTSTQTTTISQTVTQSPTSSVNESKVAASLVKSILNTALTKTTTTSSTTASPNVATRTTLIAVGTDGKPLPLVTIHSTKTVKGRGVAVTTLA